MSRNYAIFLPAAIALLLASPSHANDRWRAENGDAKYKASQTSDREEGNTEQGKYNTRTITDNNRTEQGDYNTREIKDKNDRTEQGEYNTREIKEQNPGSNTNNKTTKKGDSLSEEGANNQRNPGKSASDSKNKESSKDDTRSVVSSSGPSLDEKPPLDNSLPTGKGVSFEGGGKYEGKESDKPKTTPKDKDKDESSEKNKKTTDTKEKEKPTDTKEKEKPVAKVDKDKVEKRKEVCATAEQMRAFCTLAARYKIETEEQCKGWTATTNGKLPECVVVKDEESEQVDEEEDPIEITGNRIDVKPGQSIQDAIDKAKAGDTVVVAAGDYNEKLKIHKDGVKVVCAKPGTCKINVSNAGREGIVSIDGKNIVFSGFEINGGGKSRIGVWVKGENNIFANNNVHDINTSGGRSSVGSAIETEGKNNVIKNNVVKNVGDDALDHGIYLSEGSAIIEGNTVSNTSGFGIHLWHTPHDAKIIRNTVFNNKLGGITVGAGEHKDSNARNILVEGNHTYGNGKYGGIQEAGSVSNNTYRNNKVEDGLHLKNGKSENNTVS